MVDGWSTSPRRQQFGAVRAARPIRGDSRHFDAGVCARRRASQLLCRIMSPLRRLRLLSAHRRFGSGARIPAACEVQTCGCPREPGGPTVAPSGLDHAVRGIRAAEADVNLSVLCQLLVRFASSASCPGPAALSEEEPRRVPALRRRAHRIHTLTRYPPGSSEAVATASCPVQVSNQGVARTRLPWPSRRAKGAIVDPFGRNHERSDRRCQSQYPGALPTGSKQRASPWFELPSRNPMCSISFSNRPSYSRTYRPLRRSMT
jgi:hypothetical protein